MKLYELFEIISENEALWINDGTDAVVYDGKNSIDERYNEREIKYITVGADGILTAELESVEDLLRDCLNNMDDYDLKEVWNTYCSSYGYSENHVYSMDEFDDEFCDYSPSEIAQMVQDGNYSSWADWFTNDCGLNCSCNLDELVEIDDLVECIMSDNTCLGNMEIKRIIG